VWDDAEGEAFKDSQPFCCFVERVRCVQEDSVLPLADERWKLRAGKERYTSCETHGGYGGRLDAIETEWEEGLAGWKGPGKVRGYDGDADWHARFKM
jgi:hypothetical protein